MKVPICLVTLCFLIFHCSATHGQSPKESDQLAEWEYTQLSSPTGDALNLYAKEGWEIVTAAGGGGNGGFYKVIDMYPIKWYNKLSYSQSEGGP